MTVATRTRNPRQPTAIRKMVPKASRPGFRVASQKRRRVEAMARGATPILERKKMTMRSRRMAPRRCQGVARGMPRRSGCTAKAYGVTIERGSKRRSMDQIRRKKSMTTKAPRLTAFGSRCPGRGLRPFREGRFRLRFALGG